MHKFLAVFVLTTFLAIPLRAKRVTPAPVNPVVTTNTKYSAAGDGRRGYVLASDLITGKELWRAEIFHINIKPFLEEDVQWVFISDLKLSGKTLLVRDEKSRCYTVDLVTTHVQKSRCD